MRGKDFRLPGGYGSVVKMSNSNRRRKPYIVRITTGYEIDEEAGKLKQKYGIIGYASTREEGLQMLAKYHEEPFDLTKGDPTFREVYEEWSKEKYAGASKSTINGYRAAYNACSILMEKSFRELKVRDLQRVIDYSGKNIATLKKIRILFNQLYAYAIQNDICNKDYSKYVDLSKKRDQNPNKYDRQPFSKEEIDLFWSLSDDPYYQIILILIYTGVRISELLDLKKENVHLDEQYFDIIASKTEAGIRKVPIATRILPFFRQWYESSQIEYVFHTPDQQQFLYRNYYDSYFCALMLRHGLNQTPHCCRHTCVSLMAEANISPTYQKLIIGHKGAMSLTESVYTHIDMKQLVKAVDSMYYPAERKKEAPEPDISR